MTLQGKLDEVGEAFDERLLEEAQNDTQKMSAMRYVAGAMTYKVRTKCSRIAFNQSIIFQLDLKRGVVEEGEFIDLRSHGGLSAPTDETLLFTLKCDKGFNLMHGEGASLKDCQNVMEVTGSFIKQIFPEIPGDLVALYVKIKYHARIRALNEQEILLRKEELKRKADERKEAPKKQKTMRDFCKESFCPVRSSRSHFFCLFVCPSSCLSVWHKVLSRSLNLHISLSKVWFRSLSLFCRTDGA